MKKFEDICYSPETKQCLDLYLPEKDAFPVLVYFHGGGLEAGDKKTMPAFMEYMTARGIAVASVNYRMYPEAKYPDFLVDGAASVAWIFRHKEKYGFTGIYVGGSSAGGYMSQMLCFDRRWLGAWDISPMDIAGFVLDAGQPTCHFNVLRERGMDTRRLIVDDSAPLYHIGTDPEYPGMLVIVSDNDIENRYEQTMLMLSTLKHFGHTEGIQLKVMHGGHCQYLEAVDEKGESVFGQIVADYIRGGK